MNIELGQWVIVADIATSHYRAEYLDPSNRELRFMKKWNIPYSFLVGLPYGSTITQNESGNWVRCNRLNVEEFVQSIQDQLKAEGYGSGDEEDAEEATEAKDESPIVSTGAQGKQKLTADEVIMMKNEGIGLRDLIIELCKGSESFRRRTHFSQEKYIRKKLGRHLLLLSINKVDLVSIYRAYAGGHCSLGLTGGGGQTKGGNWITPEYLGFILNEGDVCSGRNILVFDQCTGYLTAGVMSRLGGHGWLMAASEFKGSSSHMMKQMNFNEQFMSVFREIPYNLLADASKEGLNSTTIKEKYSCFFEGAVIEDKPHLPEHHRKRIREAIERRDRRLAARLQCWQQLSNKSVDTVIAAITCSSFPSNDVRLIAKCMYEIYQIAMATLKPSGQLVIYHNNLQPLSELFAFIKSRKHTWTNASLVELCHRTICTLPGRSHPQMDNSIRISQGFILRATRMINIENEPTPLSGEWITTNSSP